MKKITKKVMNAFMGFKGLSVGNTSVIINHRGNICSIVVHGNIIASKNTEGVLTFSLCGINNALNRERLRAAGIEVTIKRGILYAFDREIDENTAYWVRNDMIINEARLR